MITLLAAVDTGLDSTARIAGYGNALNKPITAVIGNAIQAGLGLLGIVFLALLIYGGILWMISAGETDKVKKATGMVVNAAIAMAFIVGAYAISQFVIGALLTATN